MASSAAQHVHCAAGMAILGVLSVTFLYISIGVNFNKKVEGP